MENKQMIKKIILGVIISYLIHSFVIMNINAYYWTESERAGFIFLSLVFSALVFVIENLNKN
jgi:hypothetical protein